MADAIVSAIPSSGPPSAPPFPANGNMDGIRVGARPEHQRRPGRRGGRRDGPAERGLAGQRTGGVADHGRLDLRQPSAPGRSSSVGCRKVSIQACCRRAEVCVRLRLKASTPAAAWFGSAPRTTSPVRRSFDSTGRLIYSLCSILSIVDAPPPCRAAFSRGREARWGVPGAGGQRGPRTAACPASPSASTREVRTWPLRTIRCSPPGGPPTATRTIAPPAWPPPSPSRPPRPGRPAPPTPARTAPARAGGDGAD